jgi:hypothetical protein
MFDEIVLFISAFVGLAVISIMVPIPIFLATLIQKVQVHRMKKVSHQSLTRFIAEFCRRLIPEYKLSEKVGVASLFAVDY